MQDLERLLCKECHQKFFGGDFNKFACPKCRVIHVRKSKKQDFIPDGLDHEQDI